MNTQGRVEMPLSLALSLLLRRGEKEFLVEVVVPAGCIPSGAAPNYAPAPDRDVTAGNRRHALGIQGMFGSLNPLVQRFGSIVIQHGHCLLAYNRAGIDARIHKMHRAACDSHAMS